MKANEFVEKWTGEQLICYQESNLKKFKVRDSDCEILSKYGFPKRVAPYLNFEELDIQSIGYIEKGYYYLGYTGVGDWIAINTTSGKIFIISHELDDYLDENYQEGEENIEECEDYNYAGFTLVNTSLEALYEFLFHYRVFVQRRLTEGTSEYRKNVENLKKKFIEVDNEAMRGADCFWNEEINKLLYRQ